MKFIVYILAFLPLISFNQTTAIPDPNFEQALINLGYDNVLDGNVLTTNIIGVDSLDLSLLSQSQTGHILDLSGIEDFSALIYLNCNFNQLISLDISNNTGLTYLACDYNWALTSLDVSQNTALIYLSCKSNQLTSLDVSNNTALTYLNCGYNLGLISLDLSHNVALTHFECASTGLQCLNIKNGNNNNIEHLFISQHPYLNCIEVDDTAWASWAVANFAYIDPSFTFSTNCNNNCSNNSTSILEDISKPDKLNIYPNPMTNTATIELPNDSEYYSLTIYDVLGNLVRTIENIHSKQLVIQREGLTNGVYLYQLSSSNNSFSGRIIIK